ncbi:MAG: peroxiredoxin [Burkholderiales bacterium]|nr:peroxiredoxin [Burkholderiales bacterium]MCE1177316.1 peroxiredoxin [Burkholderiales bacterium]
MTTATAGQYQPFKLSNYRGKNVVLYFYPKDSTPGCTTESMGFRDAYAEFEKANTVIFGISRDSLKSHDKFKANLELPFELICDADELLCQQFDVIKQKMMYGKQVRGIERSTFVINAQGELVYEWRKVKVDNHVREVLEMVQSLPA